MLRARNLGEADRIYTLFTASRGKLDAVGKGSRRPKNQVGGRLQLLSESTLLLHRGRSLDVISQVSLVRSHWLGLVEPERFAAASLFAEIVDLFCEPDLALPEVYALLTGAAAALAASDDPAGLVPRFQLRLLDALGLAPPPESCVRCGGALGAAPAWLDVDAGGLACERCGGARGESNRLAPEDVVNFRGVGAARGGPIPALTHATPRTARAIDELITYHLGKRPKSRALVGSGLAAGR